MDDLILYGGEVKTKGNDIVEGHLVMFSTKSDPDISAQRDFFTPETDYDLEYATKTRVLYRHGFDKELGLKRLAIGEMKMDDVGVWVEGQMQLRDDYEKAVFSMAKAGKLGWSSGTASHLVEREKVGDANKVLRWPLGLDASLTPDPAEPRTLVSVKTLMEGFTPESIDTERDFEAFLRKAGGFSKEESKAITSLSFKKYLELRRREAGGDDGADWSALHSQTLRLRAQLQSAGV